VQAFQSKLHQITTDQWAEYEDKGYLKLGGVVDLSELEALRQRIDDIMMGTAQVDYDKLYMQLDSETGAYESLDFSSNRWKGPTLKYRKIQDLEADPLFMDLIEKPLFREICDHVYGQGSGISCFRAMFMNKPAMSGTLLPWHQDAWADLDRQPIITLWTALDPATIANGCVEVVPGTHKLGRVNPDHGSGFLNADQIAAYCKSEDSVFIELEAGESVLLHNWLMHRSDVNRTEIPRRAFSVCYMDAGTISASGAEFTKLFAN
jgi:phytanoyl-CoA hydroxylase